MGVSLTFVVGSSAHAVGREIKDPCDAIGTQALCDLVQVGKLEAGSYQGRVDPAVGRELTLALAADSTFFGSRAGRRMLRVYTWRRQ